MTASTDMSTPVTRGELRAEIEQLELRIDQRFERLEQRLDQNFATKVDFANFATKVDFANFATKADFANFATKADLANFATKADLANFATKADLANFATKTDLANFATKTDLETWGGALLEHLRTEFARHVRAIQETMLVQISVVDEKYKDLPGRVNRLEATVFGPEGPLIRTGPRRRRRAGRRPA